MLTYNISGDLYFYFIVIVTSDKGARCRPGQMQRMLFISGRDR